jgi:hypothetical protein
MVLFSAMYLGALMGELIVATLLHVILRKFRVNNLLLVAVVTVMFAITLSNYNHPAPYDEFNWLSDIGYALAIIPVYFFLKRNSKPLAERIA